jgi:hypothetical protein
MSKHDGATICLREGGLNYFDPEFLWQAALLEKP